MAIETERRFLVKENWKSEIGAYFTSFIEQSYLINTPDLIIRARSETRSQLNVHNVEYYGYITIKGPKVNGSGMEIENAITWEDARKLIDSQDTPVIVKTRYSVLIEGLIWEIDEFHETNNGLVIAEVELRDINQNITLPSWINREITHDHRYANSNLVTNPYSNWNHTDIHIELKQLQFTVDQEYNDYHYYIQKRNLKSECKWYLHCEGEKIPQLFKNTLSINEGFDSPEDALQSLEFYLKMEYTYTSPIGFITLRQLNKIKSENAVDIVAEKHYNTPYGFFVKLFKTVPSSHLDLTGRELVKSWDDEIYKGNINRILNECDCSEFVRFLLQKYITLI
ncbi:MAG: CYTH domain-containing protein [Nitrososphaeraceae archaeon]